MWGSRVLILKQLHTVLLLLVLLVVQVEWFCWRNWLPLFELLRDWGCITNVFRTLQNIHLKFVYCKNYNSYENFNPKLCTCVQSHALGARTKFQLWYLRHKYDFWRFIFSRDYLEISRNVSETTPCTPTSSSSHCFLELASCPWKRLHMDFAGECKGFFFLIVIDSN